MVVGGHGRFVWYGLMTTEVKAAQAFYAEVVGWEMQDVPSPDVPFVLFGAGRSAIGGLMSLTPEARRMGALPTWIGYVEVDDVDATARRVAQLGGVVRVPPTDIPGVSRFSLITDPDMAALALIKWEQPEQQPPRKLDQAGNVGWHELLTADAGKAFAFYRELFNWERADAIRDSIGTYQLFAVGGQTIGGMCGRPASVPASVWLYYFNVGDIDTATAQVKGGGGEVLEGPVEVLRDRWVARCLDSRGAMFALQGSRSRKSPGYFEGATTQDPTRRRWAW